MKVRGKLLLVLASAAFIVLALSGCFLLPTVPKTTLQIYAVNANSGPAVADSIVTVKEGSVIVATGKTDTNGMLSVQIPYNKLVDIYLKKDGYALSSVEGLKVYPNVINKVEMVQMEAILNPDPSSQSLPLVDVALTTQSGTPISSGDTVEKDFDYSVTVKSSNDIQFIYAALGKVPGAHYMTGKRDIHLYNKSATGTISISGFEGETALHFVVYDYNDNRVDKIIYLDIEPVSTTSTVLFYIPQKVSATAYTTNREVGFFGKSALEKRAIIEKFSHTNFAKFAPKAAPKDSNLWIDVKWQDWKDSSATLTTDEPLGYNVYRSFDGTSFKKIQFVQGPDQNLFRDKSAELAPGKEVWYKITSEYANGVESTSSTVVHTTPLERWNVILLTPADRATNVLRDPTFSWKPANIVTGSSTITYEYLMMLSDDVNGGNDSFAPIDSKGNFYELFDKTGGPVSMKFTDPYAWYDIYTGNLYPDKTLEPNKTYQWDLIFAVAYNSENTAFSIASDWWPFLYPIGNAPYASNRFTTGTK